MQKFKFLTFSILTVSMIALVNCGKKDFSQDTSNPIPNNPNGYVGGNSAIKIVINEYPVDAVISTTSQFVDFRVVPVSSTLKDVTCKLDGTDVPCEAEDRIEINGLAVGTHTFEIHATNSKDESASEVIDWALFNKLVAKTKDIPITTNRTADIIINVDNSYSMADIQTNMANRISNLLTKINALDSYRISVITTDWYSTLSSHSAYTDGQFDKYSNGTYCLNKGVANASTMLGNLVQREESINQPTSGNGYERGIYTTYRAFERYKTAGSPEANCLRKDVPKHVILISDENEAKYQEDDDGNPITSKPLSNGQKSNGDNLIKLASSTFGSSSFTFHSIIINPYTTEGETCLKKKQEFSYNSKYGTDFAKLSQKTNGVIGSVCASDYSAQLAIIGESIASSERVFGLDCVPSSVESVKRISTNQNVTAYSMSGNKIEFTADLPTDTYRVTYYCPE